MKNRTAVLLGSLLIVIGLFSIVDLVFDINLWSLILPLFLISVGLFIILKPKTMPGGSEFVLRFVNDSRERDDWKLESGEYLSFVSNLEWDLSKVDVKDGETRIRMNSFVNDLKLTLPDHAGLKLVSKGFVHDTKVQGRDEDHIFATFEYETPDYQLQSKQIFIELLAFVSEIEINKIKV